MISMKVSSVKEKSRNSFKVSIISVYLLRSFLWALLQWLLSWSLESLPLNSEFDSHCVPYTCDIMSKLN